MANKGQQLFLVDANRSREKYNLFLIQKYSRTSVALTG